MEKKKNKKEESNPIVAQIINKVINPINPLPVVVDDDEWELEKEHRRNDIFSEALNSVEQSIKITKKIITNANVVTPTIFKERTTWAAVGKGLNNEHAQRFNEVLKRLPDREFVRVYLKTMEFFKPKVIRESNDNKKDNKLIVTVHVNRGTDRNDTSNKKQA